MKYAFLSEKAAALYGTTLWKTSEGLEVELTYVSDCQNPKEAGYLWPDAQFVGLVEKFSRKGRRGPLFLPIPLAQVAGLHNVRHSA